MSIPQALIRKKRDGRALSADEIQSFIAGVTDESIPAYQVSAMLMAIFFRGLSDAELAAWADAMLHSGDVLDLSSVPLPKVDKHSTGGVGDKISLPLAPSVAACGVAVPMVSGRGLGHTGGTLDKLESIPGFSIHMDAGQFTKQVRELGVCLIGQTERIAPADRRLYALRDVTATVESIPLIASSIMSKKLAEGIDALVLDVKVGQGAFMENVEQARKLFAAMRVIGEAAGKKVSALLTDMNAPIGTMVGHSLEVIESIDVLRGAGPPDTRELTVRLGAEMLTATGVQPDEARAVRAMETVLDDGSALARFRELVAAQGGDPRAVDDPASILPRAKNIVAVEAARSGVVQRVNAYEIGMACLELGGGRLRTDDVVDPGVGVEVLLRVGDDVQKGQPLARLHENGKGVAAATNRVVSAFSIEDDVAPRADTRILEVLR